jgi:PncC family amidohydrolase
MNLIIRTIGQSLLKNKLTLATAESCTGGLIAGAITDTPGSSAYFKGSIVAYENSIKEKLLGVSHQTLLTYGAVSKETAEEMAIGACKALTTECAISVTGIAGPGGATETKPVGLVFIGICIQEKTRVHQCRFYGTREMIRNTTAKAALLYFSEFLT